MTKGEAYQNSTLFLGLTKKNGFKALKLYSYKPIDGTGDFTWARSSTAYRFAQSGILEIMAIGVPRVDYSNTCPELLIEKQSTNLLKHSQEFDNTDWVKINTTVTANATTAPDGTTTADKLIPSAVNGRHSIDQNITSITGFYTQSVYAKKSELDKFSLYDATNTGGWVSFDLTNGTILSTGAGATGTIKNISNGWYCCTITFNCTLKTRIDVWILPNSYTTGDPFLSPFTGNGTDGIYLWGGQLESGEYATSYILTGNSTVTRVADVAYNNSLDMTAGTGTLFIRARVKSSTFDKVDVIATLNDTSDEGYITMYTDENNNLTISTYVNPDQNDYTYALGANGIYNIAVGYDLNLAKINIAVNGVLKRANATTANALVGGVLRIDLGSIYNGISPQIDNRIIGAMWFDTQLSDSDIVAITA